MAETAGSDAAGAPVPAQPPTSSSADGDSAPAAAAAPAADEVAPALRARADALKTEANGMFSAGHFEQAIAVYSEAIDACPSAVLFANRAAAYLRTEAFGLAQVDAKRAIELDPAYVKGYYRLGSAHAVLGHYKDALKVFKRVVLLAPTDRDARNKYKQCEREVKRQAFEAAIAVEAPAPLSETLDASAIPVPDGYDGPRLPGSDDGAPAVTREFVEAMVAHMKAQKQLPKRYVVQMLVQLVKLFRELPSLVELKVPAPSDACPDPYFTVCGDTHGQFYDLLNIFEVNGGPPAPERPYLFNGDFVDRGSFSLEVVLTLLAYKLLYPEHMHMLRGNHETTNMNKIYGFDGEVKHKYDDQVLALFTEVFRWLPLCATVGGKVVVMHGGLFQRDGVKLADIRRIPRNCEPPESGLMSDILWSDPQPFPGRGPSKRGVGLAFGPDITRAFLEDNGLELLVRSHEVKDEGYLQEHDGKLVTVFSAPNYCDQMGNKGALIRFRADCKPEFKQFTAVPHPDIRPMAYAGNMGMFGM